MVGIGLRVHQALRAVWLRLLRNYHLHKVALAHCKLVRPRVVLDGDIGDTWVDVMDPILFLFLFVVVELVLQPVR